jgi:hypothetical protein
MKKISEYRPLLLLGCALASGCTQTYTPPAIAHPATSLVVEGFIDGGPDSTYFDLTHTYPLDSTSNPPPELGAGITIEGSDNSSYTLGEIGGGLYGIQLPGLQPAATYRIHIRTTSGKEYASDFVPVVTNPPIDSINWVRVPSGLNIYANTHGTSGTTPYFRYQYAETWKFYSAFFATLQYSNGAFVNYSPNTIDSCWKSDISTRIILASSTQLAQNEIYEAPLVFIPLAAQQLSVKYSILVTQYALSKDAYAWWSILQNNTENIGSIFGVQPSVDQGNIHCLTDSTEQVIGYVSAGTTQSKRIFISEDQVFPWDFISPCLLDSCPTDQMGAYYTTGFLPVQWETQTHSALYIGWKTCVDCTLTGTNVQPPFWQ